MFKEKNDKIENVISEALWLQEKGKSIPEILSLFPEYKEELNDIFKIIVDLAQQKDIICPNKKLLEDIIRQVSLNKNVTNIEENRYLLYSDEKTKKGRSSISEEVLNVIENMNKKWRILLPVGIAVLLLVVFTSGRRFKNRLILPIDNIASETDLSADDFDKTLGEFDNINESEDDLDTLNQIILNLETPGASGNTGNTGNQSQPSSPTKITTSDLDNLLKEADQSKSNVDSAIKDLDGIDETEDNPLSL